MKINENVTMIMIMMKIKGKETMKIKMKGKETKK